MSDLQYTLGLDAGGFAAAASRAVSMLGSMELAVQGIQRAADAMASAFNQAAAMERTAVAIGTITKNAKVTAEVMRDLKELSADTPFEMSDLAPAARALLGAGTAAGTVSNQLKMLGDIAAGADTDLQGLVSVFNQVRGKGKLSAEEFQQFAERGVAGLREEIAKFKGISLDSVGDSLSRGLVSAKDLEAVFGRMTSAGGIAFQAMERQSQTFSGKLSTLSDAWAGLQIAFAQPINDALKPVIDDLTNLTETLEPAFGMIGEQVAGVVSAARDFVMEIGQGSGVVKALGDSFGELFSSLGDFAKIPLGAFIDGIPSLIAAFMEAIGPLTEWMAVKFFVVAKDFEASMLTAIANVMKAAGESSSLLSGLVTAGAGVANQASQSRIEARGGDAVLNSGVMDTGARLKVAEDLLVQGMGEIFTGAKKRLNTFLGDAPARMEQAAAPARGYDGRYAQSGNADSRVYAADTSGPESAALSSSMTELQTQTDALGNAVGSLQLQAESFGAAVASALAERVATTATSTAQPTPTPPALGDAASLSKLDVIAAKLEENTKELQRINTE